jgi:hypothetical protein
MTARQAVLVGDALLVVVTLSAAAHGHVLGWSLAFSAGLVAAILTTLIMVDRRHMKPRSGQAPSVHVQVDALSVLDVPSVRDQLARIRLRWIPAQCGGRVCGLMSFDPSGLIIQPDWLARRDGFGLFRINADDIVNFRRKPQPGQLNDLFIVTLRDGHELRLELRQPDFATSQFAAMGLSTVGA